MRDSPIAIVNDKRRYVLKFSTVKVFHLIVIANREAAGIVSR